MSNVWDSIDRFIQFVHDNEAEHISGVIENRFGDSLQLTEEDLRDICTWLEAATEYQEDQ